MIFHLILTMNNNNNAKESGTAMPCGSNGVYSTTAPSDGYSLQFENGLELTDTAKRMFCRVAEECEIEAAQASRFVNAAVKGLSDIVANERAEARARLLNEWGLGYEEEMHKVSCYINSVAQASGWGQEEVEALCTPLAFRLVHGFMEYSNAGKKA